MEMRKAVPGSLLFLFVGLPRSSVPPHNEKELRVAFGIPLQISYPLPRESCVVSRVTLACVLVSGVTLGVL